LRQYSGYLSPRRRRDWLLGRWTAKRLIQKHIAATNGFCPALDSFRIEADGSGAPILASQHPALCGTHTDGRVPLALSISHSSGYAFCALCDDARGQVRLGVDIEFVEPRHASFAQEFFTPAEQASLHAAPAALRDLLTTATWSAKEAALKATRLGLRADPRSGECLLRPATPRHWTPLRVAMQPATQVQAGAIGPLAAWWRTIDNRLLPGTTFVLTLAAYGVRL
jgi:4'-phosphopantetheinyl transferase